MKGDFTRFTWNPTKHYSSVRMQQGRVQTDADWNEQVEIGTYVRERALADVIGRCCAPREGGGFEISSVPGGGDLAISAGRLYVDGVLCELEDALTYLAQPDFPGASLPAAAGFYMVYLDVWQWHVTALEDPEIRERALGGPDTATRTRTVCQVKLGPAAGQDLDCEAPLPPETAAPTGRMRARAQPEDGDEGPCVVPATAGYTRLENQLYRVEVHDSGALGTATFKWSRDNGSIVTDWLAQDGDELTVGSTGRDRVLGFHSASWVELTDDEHELRGEPGLLVRVARVEGDVIEIDPEGQLVNFADFQTHPKVRRWDMPDTAPGALTIEVAADNEGYLRLESGVQVRFGAGTYRGGDYWVIPARAFIGEFAGDVEWPRDGANPRALEPRGIEHRYCKLAVVEFDAQRFVGEPGDCRHSFAPLCAIDGGCCTVVVEPGESIQAALDSLPDEGGCVCLKTGVHEIAEPIRIETPNVVLHGESPGAVVMRRRGVRMLDVGGPGVSRILIESVHFEARPPTAMADSLLNLSRCRQVTVRDCEIGSSPSALVAVGIRRGHAIRLTRCTISGTENAVVANRDSTDVGVLESRLTGVGFSFVSGIYGVLLDETTGDNRVEGNLIEDFVLSVRVDADAAGTVVAANRIERAAMDDPGNRLFAIDVAAPGCQVRDNVIGLSGSRYGGVRVTAPDVTVEANRIESSVTDPEGELPAGIFVGVISPNAPPPDRCTVRHNRLSGLQDAILVAGVAGFPVTATRIQGNRIEGPTRIESSIGISLERSSQGMVDGNEIYGVGLGVELEDGAGNRVLDSRIVDGATGVLATREDALEVSRNQVDNMSRLGFGGAELTGAVAISHCRFSHCAWEGSNDLAALGVAVLNGAQVVELAIDSCEIVDTGISRDGTPVTQPAIGIWGAFLHACQITRNLVTVRQGSDIEYDRSDRALFLLGSQALRARLVFGNSRLTLTFASGSAQIVDNKFVGPGAPALIDVGFMTRVSETLDAGWTFAKLIFANNHVHHFAPPVDLPPGAPTPPDPAALGDLIGVATISYGILDAVVQGNQVKAAPEDPSNNLGFFYPSMNFNDVGLITLQGNMTTGSLIRLGSVKPANYPDFNWESLIF